MEMEMSVDAMERLAAAACALESAVARVTAIEVSAAEGLEARLATAEAKLEELSGRMLSAGSPESRAVSIGRKTMHARGSEVEGLSAGIDAALVSLSLEQRIAVKAALMRGGLLG